VGFRKGPRRVITWRARGKFKGVNRESADPQVIACQCSNWEEIAESLEWFPAPEVSLEPQGGVSRNPWVFRGLGSSRYELQPSIERELHADSMGWHALEHPLSEEFKARAGMHLSAPLVPEDELSWLALMQHHGVPTRLLDFTYSPFIALYFAVRACRAPSCRSGRQIRLWAIHEESVNGRFKYAARKAQGKSDRVGMSRENQSDERDDLIGGTVGIRQDIEKFIPARGKLQDELDHRGCVCAISPRAFNPRLASQQGVFLLNLAPGLTFNQSLATMMKPNQIFSGGGTRWCKKFDIAVKAVPEIERKLFQMNIHEQSLFPDMQGLAGLIKQRLRLHWNRPHNAGA
jgi:hypothetical protein